MILDAVSNKTKLDIAIIKSKVIAHILDSPQKDIYGTEWRNIAIETFGVGDMWRTTFLVYRPIWAELTDIIQ